MDDLTKLRDTLQEEYDERDYEFSWGMFLLGRIHTLLGKLEQAEAELTKLQTVQLPDGTISNTFEAYLAWKSRAEQAEAERGRLRAALYDAVCLQVEHNDEIFADIELDHEEGIASLKE